MKEACLSWLRVNLLSHMPEHPDRLREITPELMADLVASPGMRIASQLKFVGPLHGKSYLVDAEPFR